jgi:RNA polymerase sigma factor (sigma-70 family)
MTDDGATQCARRARAWLHLIKKVEGELSGFIHKRVGSGSVTQEIVHKTFNQAWDDAEFDPEHANARAWLFNKARWLVYDWLRSAESHLISLEDLLIEGMRRDGSWDSRFLQPVDRRLRDPMIDLIEEEGKRKLDAALARLKEDDREILTRYYLLQEGTQFEIAEAMGIPPWVFNNRLNGARKRLKLELLRGRD